MKKQQELGQKRRLSKILIGDILAETEKNFTSIALDLNISLAAVSAVINGKRHNPRVLDALLKNGVPCKYLFDPRAI